MKGWLLSLQTGGQFECEQVAVLARIRTQGISDPNAQRLTIDLLVKVDRYPGAIFIVVTIMPTVDMDYCLADVLYSGPLRQDTNAVSLRG